LVLKPSFGPFTSIYQTDRNISFFLNQASFVIINSALKEKAIVGSKRELAKNIFLEIHFLRG
jgi:hypothetical protein